MPAPDPSRVGHPDPRPRHDPAAIPAFLRERDGPAIRAASGRDAPPAVLPRPANPRPTADPEPPAFDPAGLPLPSLSRRRVFTVAGVLLAAWLTISFARQVGEASAATARAEDLRAANAALRDEIAQLEADLSRVQDRNYILLQGRGAGLGGRNEIAFALGADAPPLAADAPGSAAVRLGSTTESETALDVWLAVLFGGD